MLDLTSYIIIILRVEKSWSNWMDMLNITISQSLPNFYTEDEVKACQVMFFFLNVVLHFNKTKNTINLSPKGKYLLKICIRIKL